MSEAASVTFYALLSLVPAITALVSLYDLVADPSTIAKRLDALAGVIPQGGMEIIAKQVRRLIANPSGELGIGLVVGKCRDGDADRARYDDGCAKAARAPRREGRRYGDVTPVGWTWRQTSLHLDRPMRDMPASGILRGSSAPHDLCHHADHQR